MFLSPGRTIPTIAQGETWGSVNILFYSLELLCCEPTQVWAHNAKDHRRRVIPLIPWVSPWATIVSGLPPSRHPVSNAIVKRDKFSRAVAGISAISMARLGQGPSTAMARLLKIATQSRGFAINQNQDRHHTEVVPVSVFIGWHRQLGLQISHIRDSFSRHLCVW